MEKQLEWIMQNFKVGIWKWGITNNNFENEDVDDDDVEEGILWQFET